MENEIQLKTLSLLALMSTNSIIGLSVNYTDEPIFILCLTNKDYIRVYNKLKKDYKEDNYLLSARRYYYCKKYGMVINNIKLKI